MKMFQQYFSFVLLVMGCRILEAIGGPSDLYVEARPDWRTEITCPLEAEDFEWEGPRGCESRLSRKKTQLLPEVELHCAGVYTCSDAEDPRRRARLHVLIPGKGSPKLRCQTDSYSSSQLNCSIADDFLCPCEVTANASRGGAFSSSKWSTNTREEVHDIHFPVSLATVNCSYGEDVQRIYLSVKVRTEKEYWHKDTPILMADIVVPGPPENGRVTCDQISWRYPSNWSDSSSFYPLLFHLDLKLRNNSHMLRKVEGHTNYTLKDVKEFRVQCRDPYSPSSPWSAWSPAFRRDC